MPTPRESRASLFRQAFDLDIAQETQRPVVRLCHLILTEGMLTDASAIRLQVLDGDNGGVEYEVAGSWRMVMQIPIQAFRSVINRLKVMAALDISRRPSQVGEVHVRLKGTVRILPIRIELNGEQDTAMLTVSGGGAA